MSNTPFSKGINSNLSSFNSSNRAVIPLIKGTKAFTLLELMVVIAIIGILASIAVGSFQYYKKKAFNVVARHDLKNFVTAQEGYYTENSRYLGSNGDFVKGGNPVSGSLISPEFKARPSDGVKVEIISGDGANFQGPPPFTASAAHESGSKKYIYDFSTSQMTEEER